MGDAEQNMLIISWQSFRVDWPHSVLYVYVSKCMYVLYMWDCLCVCAEMAMSHGTANELIKTCVGVFNDVLSAYRMHFTGLCFVLECLCFVTSSVCVCVCVQLSPAQERLIFIFAEQLDIQ